MIRKYLCILAVMCLMFSASGCKTAQPQPQEQPYPTLPDFQEDMTPLQQLTAAIEKTRGQGEYEVRYGTNTVRDGQVEENSRLQSVSLQNPLDRDDMYEYLPLLPQKDGFLEEFCGRSMQVVPSNTGILRFQLADLEWEEAWQMMYDREPEGEFPQERCEIAFEVDAAGCFSGFEIIMTQEEETVKVFLSITFPEDA